MRSTRARYGISPKTALPVAVKVADEADAALLIAQEHLVRQLANVEEFDVAVEASKRARELIGGSMPLIDTKEFKPLSIAIEEINRGLITYSREEEEPEEN